MKKSKIKMENFIDIKNNATTIFVAVTVLTLIISACFFYKAGTAFKESVNSSDNIVELLFAEIFYEPQESEQHPLQDAFIAIDVIDSKLVIKDSIFSLGNSKNGICINVPAGANDFCWNGEFVKYLYKDINIIAGQKDSLNKISEPIIVDESYPHYSLVKNIADNNAVVIAATWNGRGNEIFAAEQTKKHALELADTARVHSGYTNIDFMGQPLYVASSYSVIIEDDILVIEDPIGTKVIITPSSHTAADVGFDNTYEVCEGVQFYFDSDEDFIGEEHLKPYLWKIDKTFLNVLSNDNEMLTLVFEGIDNPTNENAVG